jgi:membrane protease YdiL (CAAX protease family)
MRPRLLGNPLPWLVVVAGLALFCGLSQLGRTTTPLFSAAVVLGIVQPMAWAWAAGSWAAMGFARRHMRKGIAWGIAAGVVSSLVGLSVLDRSWGAQALGRQVLIGVPLWLLVISPFQEFFFRGWMQSILNEHLGPWWDLLVANLCFTTGT